jgi:hypothetical protein
VRAYRRFISGINKIAATMKKILIIYFTLTTVLSFAQDTVIRRYRPLINYKTYSEMLTGEQRINNSVVKVIDLRGKVRFVGQVYSDCGRDYIGDTKEFYRNGKIKAIRKYTLEGKGCPFRNGVWTYYKKNGNVKKMIEYKKDIVIHEIKP